jgi:hypothetical protein
VYPRRRNPRIVPAADPVLLDQLQQLALAHQRVGEVQPGKFDLLRMIDLQLIEKPIVQRAMVLELQRADRVRDLFDRIGLPVREIVHRINAPSVPGAMVRRVQDAIEHRIAHIQIGRSHVDLGPQRARAVGEFAGPHPPKQFEILRRRALAVGAVLARRGERAAIFAHLLGVQIADEGLAGRDQLLGPIVKLLKIIRGIKQPVLPIEAQPADAVLDRVDVLDVLLAGIRIVEAQIAQPTVALREPEIQADALGVADVQIPVRLGRKAGVDPSGIFAGAIVLLDNLLDEVQPPLGLRRSITAGASFFGLGFTLGMCFFFVVHANDYPKLPSIATGEIGRACVISQIVDVRGL